VVTVLTVAMVLRVISMEGDVTGKVAVEVRVVIELAVAVKVRKRHWKCEG
jgi:hypothetical protein